MDRNARALRAVRRAEATVRRRADDRQATVRPRLPHRTGSILTLPRPGRTVPCVAWSDSRGSFVPVRRRIEVIVVAELPSAGAHEAYIRIHQSEDFALLRRKFRHFVIPTTIAFMAWYLLYVVMSSWAGDFMSTKVVGHINIALIFGLLQFVSTFVIARMYSTYANRELDPIAAKLEREFGGRADR
jgi:uncharacterized membrane protein (DUF485 family)